MDTEWELKVANPSPYDRSDYVEFDLDALGVDSSLNETSLSLHRKDLSGDLVEIPYQIDYVLGKRAGKRILTFYAKKVPSSPVDDYSQMSATFVLKQGAPRDFSTPIGSKLLNIDYYHNPVDPKKAILST